MPRVSFLNDQIEGSGPPGTSLAQVAAEAGASLPFGCRAGTCGTCALHVLSGLEGLDEVGFEDDTLHVLGLAAEGRRLGCQIILRDTDLEVAW
jgi:ferredoxin